MSQHNARTDKVTLDLFTAEGAPPARDLRPLAELRLQIEQAQKDSATWRGAGNFEKYLETESLIAALELQLAARRYAGT